MKKIKALSRVLILLAAAIFISSSAYAEQEKESLDVEITPSILYPEVKGDREKFEEDNWISRDTSGGLSSITFSKDLNDKDSLEFEGKGIAGTNDYDAELNFSREGVGTLTFGFKEYRKYYDGTGGFYENFPITSFHPMELENDLHLDIGDFKFEGVLAKENSPEFSLGYEREFRHGSKSLVSWGSMVSGAVTRNINPTYVDLDETVDKVKFGVKHVTKDAEISAKQIWEGARSESSKINNQTQDVSFLTPYDIRKKSETTDSDLYSTQVMLSKDLNKNLFMSCGLLYNHYNGGSLEAITDTGITTNNENHPLNPATISQESVTFMPNASFTPLKGLVVSAGLKGQFETTNGEAKYNRDYRTTAVNFRPDGIVDELINITTNTTKKRLSELIQFKYNRMKNIVFYGDAGFEKELISQFEVQDSFGNNPAAGSAFSRKTNSRIGKNDFTLGLKWFPVSSVNLSVEDKYKNKVVDNRNEFLTGDAVGGYSAYIDTMELSSNTPTVKLNYKPFRWISGSLGYIYERAAFGIRTRASDTTEFSKQEVKTYNAILTLNPAESFYCSLFYERRNDRTTTPTNGSGGTTARLPDFEANVDIWGVDYSYALCKNTAITGGYSMYNTGNFNDYSTTGMPLGVDNLSQKLSFGIRNSFTKDHSLELKYSYLNYEEDSNNHIDDYEAHLFAASMKLLF